MKTYIVGGFLRDQLLGIEAQDKDFVVVGSTPEEMLARGFQPIGQDFPVFLHPQTKEEYALARTERKSGHGYKGFTFFTNPEVTLEQDLYRRDFTINAIAQEINLEGERIGPFIDPFGGQLDLAKKTIKHISPAFEEDPLRILRLARFMAKLNDFMIDPNTLHLVKQMVANGELKYLVPERVWQEFSKGLLEKDPSRMLEVLQDINASEYFFPPDFEQPNLFKKTKELVHLGANHQQDLSNQLAYLLSQIDIDQLGRWVTQWKIPNELQQFAKIFNLLLKSHPSVLKEAVSTLAFFDQVDLWRKPERFEKALHAANRVGIDIVMWEKFIRAALSIDSGAIAKKTESQDGRLIQAAVAKARLQAIVACQ